ALDRPALDSWSARAGWRRGYWYAQASGGRLHRPEAFEPFDLTRLTASIEYNGAIWPSARGGYRAVGRESRDPRRLRRLSRRVDRRRGRRRIRLRTRGICRERHSRSRS